METIPYLKHADVGLSTLQTSPQAIASFTDSLKIIQYTYCGLPIVVPEPLRSPRPNIFCYVPNDVVSIQETLRAARAFDRRKVVTDDISSWDEIAQELAGQELS